MRFCFLFLLAFIFSGCGTLPQDESARFHIYQQRLSALEFPVSRARLYRTLRPASPAQPTGASGAGLLSGSEFYRLDDVFIIEMSVVYKAVAGFEDYFDPAPSFRSQVHGILDAAQSIDNFVNRGTPEHPADIIRKARIVKRPAWRTADARGNFPRS